MSFAQPCLEVVQSLLERRCHCLPQSHVVISFPSNLSLSCCAFSLLALSLADREMTKLSTRSIMAPNASDLLLSHPSSATTSISSTNLCFFPSARRLSCGSRVIWG